MLRRKETCEALRGRDAAIRSTARLLSELTRCWPRRVCAAGLLAAITVLPAVTRAEGQAGASVSSREAPIGRTIRGRIVDATSGEPLENALVQVSGTSKVTVTDGDGRFELRGVVPDRADGATAAGAASAARNRPASAGEGHIVSLYVSVVGYGLARRDVPVDAVEDLTIPLARGSSAYTEAVTVRGDVFRREAPGVPVQQSLDSRDLQELRGVLTDDPGRAIQVLPGVATSDDLRGEFTVRGSDFAHLNVVFDGVPNPFLFHTVRAVDDSGSIAAINADVLDGIVLLSGSYPQRYGGRLGAQVEFRPRDGSRERRQVRGLISGTAASVLAEGPLGHAKRGSWLVSARRSYLDWLLKTLDSTATAAFGFYDVFGRGVYDVSPSQRLEVSAIAGRSEADDLAEQVGPNNFRVGAHATRLVSVAWKYQPTSALSTTQRAYATGASYDNANAQQQVLDSGADGAIGWRGEVVYTLSPVALIEGGGNVQRLTENRAQRRYTTDGAARSVASLDGASHQRGAYVLWRQSVGTRLVLTPGLRADTWTIVERSALSPSVQAEWIVSESTRVTAGAGRYAQPPTLVQQAQAVPGSRLALERATHVDVGIERRLGRSMRVQVAAYARREQDLAWRPDSDPRLVDGVFRVPSFQPYGNALSGRSRGLELLLQRRSSNGLTGWVSYAWARTEDTDETSGEVFDRQVDQRHTLNVYGQYRVSSRLSVSGKLRVGDNFPLSGYLRRVGEDFFVGDERHDLRAPTYARLDGRANYVFDFSRRRFTLFAEVINALGHTNYRTADPSIDLRTGRVRGVTEELFPFLPSAGLLIEF
jgi:hypothetical protein